MKKIELLSPAGNMDCLKAAIEAECDAVYLSGNLFGARSFAGNFSNEELEEAISYAHLYGVKVYVAINTIIYEREVDKFIEFVRFIHKANADAVIVQDLGMMDLIRKKFPNLEIHASTQMNIHNYEGALFAKNLGIKRIVMARETNIEVIRRIKEELGIDIEVFVHGALCVSYSGQCLMSALVGGRSGNRGTCAQVCRKPYDLYDEDNNKLNKDKYLLSTKDLCTLNYLDKIIDAGVDSLKIEGRMKRPEYVYLVTKIYRKVINNYLKYGKLNVSEEEVLQLKRLFNRGFTKGFMLGEQNKEIVYQKRPNHQGIKVGKVMSYKNGNLKIKLDERVNLHDGLRIMDDKEDKGLTINKMFINNKEVKTASRGDKIKLKYDRFVKVGSDVLLTTDHEQIENINLNLKKLRRKVPIDVYIKAKLGKKFLIEVTDSKNKVSLETDFLIEKALNKPTNKETIINQVKKTGNTIYEVNKIDVLLDKNVFINLKNINELRRRVLLKLDSKRLYEIPFVEKEYSISVSNFEKVNKRCILLNSKKDYEKYRSHYDVIYTENKKLLNNDVNLKLPRVINEYPKCDNNLVLVGEVGSLIKCKNVETDFSFNVVNSYTLAFLHSMGVKKVTLSYELTLSQIKLMIENYESRYKTHPNVEVISNSYPEAMITKFDLAKMYGIKKGYLKDSFGNNYKIVRSEEFMTIYNFKKLKIENEEDYYNAGVNYLRININTGL